MKCNRCDQDILSTEVQCRGCKSEYHFVCSISEATYRAKSKSAKATWRCAVCRSAKNAVTGSATVDEDGDEGDSDTNEESSQSKVTLDAILKSIQFMSNKFDNLSSRFDQSIQENQELKEEIKGLKRMLERKDEQIAELDVRVNVLEQRSKRKYVEIHGVSDNDQISPENQFEKIAQSVGCGNITPITVTKIKLANSSFLLAKMESAELKRTFLKKGKQWWANLSELEKKSNAKLYFNENLTPQNRKMLKEAKIRAKIYNFKYVWVSEGRILVRKDDNQRAFRINSLSDVNKYIN
ncbi:hypothetical protein PPYR_15688 [Photinus pyralis]|uniref:Zinc finger PHD-type domain-containing protein n=1 Tax=Photinus pyralis TaxID=7054 RepID=A0A1Y1NK35_PHOPY|nr:uncharacterized protein LOC116182885 [Photinus pyralis]KAB0790019.1 hypothetical protein PPYR_15688 [Photinus pyralis]